MTVRTVTKSLAGMEDLAAGVGKTQQVRAGLTVEIGQIDQAYAVPDEAALADVDVANFTYGRVGNVEYRYDADATEGDIKSNVGPGWWLYSGSTKVASKGSSNALGGPVWPNSPFGVADESGPAPAGTKFFNLKGGPYTEVTTFAAISQDGTTEEFSGEVSAVDLSTIPYTGDIGGTAVYFLLAHLWDTDRRDIKAFGVNGVDDEATDAIAAMKATAKDGGHYIFSAGEFPAKAESDQYILEWTNNGCTIEMQGYITLLANSEGFTPARTIFVSGDNNILIPRLDNKLDVPKKASTASVQNPMIGVFLAGTNNTCYQGEIWNYTTPIWQGGVDNSVLFNTCTVKDTDNLAWSNDIVTVTQCTRPRTLHNKGGVHDPANPRKVIFEDNPLKTTSKCRVGIAIDAEAIDVEVAHNEIGEGFVNAIHSEGTGERGGTVHNNLIYSQLRNSLNLAEGPLEVYSNTCKPVLNINNSGNPALVGQIGSIGSDVIVRNNSLFSDDDTTIAFRVRGARSPNILNNNIYGDYDLLLDAPATEVVEFKGNKHKSGACNSAYSYSKRSAVSDQFRLVFEGNEVRVRNNVGLCSSAGKLTAKNNLVYLVEGYTPITSLGIFQFSGNQGDSGNIDPKLAQFDVSGNNIIYIGTTVLVGNTFFMRFDPSTDEPYGVVYGNTFDESIAFRLVEGTAVSAAKWRVALNSTDTILNP